MESATKEIDREFDAMLRIHQEGMLDQAEAGYQEILRRAPRHHQSLGTVSYTHLTLPTILRV